MWLILLFVLIFGLGVLCGILSKQYVDEKARSAAESLDRDGEDSDDMFLL